MKFTKFMLVVDVGIWLFLCINWYKGNDLNATCQALLIFLLIQTVEHYIAKFKPNKG